MREHSRHTGVSGTLSTLLRRIALGVAVAGVLAGGAAGAAAAGMDLHLSPHLAAAPPNEGASGGSNAPVGGPTGGPNVVPNTKLPGVVLIADQYNNRVIEIDRLGNIVWQFGRGPNDYSPFSIIGVNDAQRVGPMVLMAGTGIPPKTVPTCTGPNGCPDNRVMLVNRSGHVVWQYGKFGVTGSGPNELNTPTQATYLPSGNVLITDQGNQRVIEVNMLNQIVWQYGTTGVAGVNTDQLNSPNSAELLDNGHVLIADEGNNRALEVTRSHSVVADINVGGSVNGMAFASRLPNGNTLLTDTGNSRIVEVNPQDVPVWEYFTNGQSGSNPAPLPTRAIRLANGNTIISDQFNQRVIVVDPSKKIVASFGNLDRSGYGLVNTSQGLYGPYDAKVIGDFTGLTPPFDHDGDPDDTF